MLAATDLLTTHWVTGQLRSKTPTSPPCSPGSTRRRASDAAAAAADAEALPPAGPVSDPPWDRQTLQPLIGEYGRARQAGVGEAAAAAELREAVEGELEPAWRGVWAARDLVALLPEAAHVPAAGRTTSGMDPSPGPGRRPAPRTSPAGWTSCGRTGSCTSWSGAP